MQNLKQLLFLLTPKELKSASLLLFLTLIMALLDVIGVASVLPFMTVLTNPNLIETNSILNYMFETSKIFGVKDNNQFLFALGVLVFVLLITSLIFKALTIYLQVRFIYMREYTIGRRLVEGYLHQPYTWFLNRHSADLGKNILSEVSQVISNAFIPLMELISKGMVTIALLLLLIIADPKLALVIGFMLAIIYLIIFNSASDYLKHIGKIRLDSNELRFTTVNEAFGASKEIKVGGLEEVYINRFSNSSKTFAKVQAYVQVIAQLPRFILEAIAFGGILLLILYLISKTGNFNNALPVITLYVFAGYRLLPALQQIYASLTSLRFVGPSVNKLYADLKNLKPIYLDHSKGEISFNDKIVLNNVNYNYPNESSRVALKNINLTINSNSTVGLVGSTGSGKTTTVDIILGLLEPQIGTISVDGKTISKKNLKSWQQITGYVPQQIFLSDDTILANIAFGVDPKNINHKHVEKVSKIANLHNFVADELPEKYLTKIGERGIRLSGGQRQRIGIARALYHKPKVLILDEATSALDNQTEQAVMDAVNNLRKDITIILIAHRLHTVKNCDVIFKLEKGELIESGSFLEVIRSEK